MLLCLLTSARGGCGKTTLAIRVAQEMKTRGIETGVLDLTPYPTSHLLVEDSGVAVVRGTGARTAIAAESILKPYKEGTRLLLVDTGRLSDPELDPWISLLNGVILLTPVDAFSVAALPSIWASIDSLRKANRHLRFLGMLPVMTQPEHDPTLKVLRRRFANEVLPMNVPHDLHEGRRARRAVLSGALPMSNETSPARTAWQEVATRIANDFDLLPEARAVEPRHEKVGLLGRLWKMATGRLGNAVVAR
jgi:cellulose biosynthesis protein BcsQ